MCRCFFDSMKIVVLIINVILLMCAIGLIAGGVYAYLNVNAREVITQDIKSQVPPIGAFAEVSPKREASQIKKYMSFKNTKLDEFSADSRIIIICVMAFGVCLFFISINGIVAFSCMSKNLKCLWSYMGFILIIFVPLVVLTVYSCREGLVQDSVFENFEKVALKSDPKNRYLMAMLQQQLGCCGIRGAVDYYCNGVYDYACNPGCMTYDQVWQDLKTVNYGPVCYKGKDIMDECNERAENGIPGYSKISCKSYLNVPKPISAGGAFTCKDYKDYFNGDGVSSKSLNFRPYDPARGQDRSKNPKIHGSPFFEDDFFDIRRYGDAPYRRGCGYMIWKHKAVNMDRHLMAMCVNLILVCVFIGLEAVQVVWSVILVQREKEEEEEESESETEE